MAVTALLLTAFRGPAYRMDAAQTPGAETLALVGARIYDGTGSDPLEPGVLLLHDGRIAAVGPESGVPVPEQARRIVLRGSTIVPGLINTHGHVGETVGLSSQPQLYTRGNVLEQLGVYARYGITTVFSLGGDQSPGFQVRDEQDNPTLRRSRLFVAGPVVTATTPDEARTQVEEIASLRADFVKIRVDDNLGTTAKMPPQVYQTVIDESHRRGLRVAAHIYYLEDAKSLLQAGVDFLAHSIRDREVDEELIGLLRSRNVPYCPTLMREVSTFVYQTTPEFFKDPFFRREVSAGIIEQLRDPGRQQSVRESASARQYQLALPTAERNLKRLSDAGILITLGTDTGPPGRFQGYFEHLELERMVKAGLTTRQALLSGTGAAARAMRLAGKVGTLERGAWADFLVLRKDPLADIRNTRTIDSVWVAGNPIPMAR